MAAINASEYLPKVKEHLTSVEIEGEAVIYDEADGNLHHLNRTATMVFAMCDGTATVEEVSGDISEAYGVPLEQVIEEVTLLIERFVEANLLVNPINVG